MQRLAKFSPMRQRGIIRAIPELPPVDVTRTVDEQQGKEEARFAWWVKQVGEDRARIARAIFEERTGSRTLPELLTEAWLRGQGARYVTQLNLGFAKPDFTVFDAPAAPNGALILRVQGGYWHGSSGAITRDDSQRQMLMEGTAQGAPILKIVDIWEKAIYEGTGALELAYFQGVELPQAT